MADDGELKATESETEGDERRQGQRQSLKQRWRKLTVGNQITAASNVIIAVTTGLYVLVSILTWLTVSRSSEQTSKQVGDLIRAANIQACAAQKIADASERNAAAAEKFALSADIQATAARDAAGAMANQVTKLQQSIRQNGEQFQIEQRPYVWTSERAEPSDVHIAKGEKMRINVYWVNYGHSPALREASLAQIFIGPDAMEKADRWFAGLGDKPLPPPPDGLLKERVIPPGISSDKGFGGVSTFTSDHELTEPEVNYILSTDKPLAIITRVVYYDAYGNRYWDDICLSRFRSGAIPHCDRHNEMH